MKKGIIFILVLMFTVSWAFAEKGAAIQYDPADYPAPTRQGGDTVEDATVIGSLPYNDVGETTGFIDDYDEVCPYTGSTSPDVVYSYTPAADMINGFVTLCGDTDYDSKLYIYENAVTPGAPFACVDDACTSALGVDYVSEITDLTFTGGNTYYIVVDGYNGASGGYEIDMTADPTGTTLDPPQNLMVTNEGYATWDPPSGGGTGEWLQYDIDVMGFGGIGAEASDYSLIWASKFVPEDLTAYDPGYVLKVAVNQLAAVGDYVTEVRILSGDGTTTLYTEDVTGTLVEGWNEIELASAVEFDNTENLWIAMYAERPGDTYNEPTSDVETIILERYDFFAYNGAPFTTIYNEYGYDGQGWMLRGFVSTSPSGRGVALGHVDLSNYTDYNISTSTGKGMIKIDPNYEYEKFNDSMRDLLGYDVYLDGILVGTTADLYYDYDDGSLVEGQSYMAEIIAVYDEGESEPIGYAFTYGTVTVDPPQNLMVTDEGYATWEAPAGPEQAEFRYDDGVITSQLGFGANPSSVLGASHPNDAVIDEVTWYLTSEAIHPEAIIYIFGLQPDGTPDTGQLLHESAAQPNVDDAWNTYILPSPITAPDGFFIGVCTPDIFTAIGTDDGVGDPWVFQLGTQWGIADWTAGNDWLDVGPAGFPLNFSIRAYGTDNGDIALAPRIDSNVNYANCGLVGSELSVPVNTNLSENRDFLGYNVYLNGAFVDFTTDLFYDYDDGSLINGQSYLAEVTADYDEGESDPIDYTFIYVGDPILDPPTEVAVDEVEGTVSWSAPAVGGVIIEDNFDSYTVGDHLAEVSDDWATWTPGGAGGSEDGVISDAQALSPLNSLLIEGTNDQLLIMDDYTSGVYTMELDLYIPSGFCGYWNLQKTSNPGDEWGIQIMFDVDGVAVVDAGAAAAATFTFAFDTWIHQKVIVDLDNDLATYYTDGVEIIQYQWTLGTGGGSIPALGGLNLYAWASTGNSPQCYFDNVVLSSGTTRDLTGYNVYLDGDLQDTVGIDVFDYTYDDLEEGVDYVAGVSAVYDDGESIIIEVPFTTPVDAGNVIVAVTKLNSNYPNPFNPVTNIAYSIKEAGKVTLEVYNIKGQLVKTLVNDVRETGNYTVTWSGRDNSNKSVASGVYFYKMKAQNYNNTKKMILMK